MSITYPVAVRLEGSLEHRYNIARAFIQACASNSEVKKKDLEDIYKNYKGKGTYLNYECLIYYKENDIFSTDNRKNPCYCDRPIRMWKPITEFGSL